MEKEPSSEEIIKESLSDTPQTSLPPNQPTSDHAQSIPEVIQQAQIVGIENRVNKAETRMVWLTAAIAFFALCSVVVSVLQWRTMQGQLDEMKSGSTDTHTLAEQAKVQAGAAATLASTAEATLRSTQKSFQIDQRPYLVAEIPQFIELLAAEKKIIANVSFKNIGRTPAIRAVNVGKLFRYLASDAKNETTFVNFMEREFEALRKKLTIGRDGQHASFVRRDVAPGATVFITSEITKPLSAQEIQKLVAGSLVFFYIGIDRYTDSLNETYETEFCYFYFGADPKVWHICSYHNIIK